MLRFTTRSLNILSNLICKHHFSTINRERTILHIQRNLQQARYNAEDSKFKTPLGSILNKERKDQKHVETPPPPEHPDEEETKKREQSWRTMKLTLLAFGVSFSCLGTYLVVTLGAPQKDEHGQVVEDQYSNLWTFKAYLLRTIRELEFYRKLIKEPSREKLLPDPLPYPYVQPKYTLVLEFTDVLVHPEWTYQTGWRFKKRPLLDTFLESMKDQYEIVIYTAEQGINVFPLIEKVDPKNYIAFKLVRDATYFHHGDHVKSLDNLNRDLSKVVVIDWNKNSVKFNPENLFCIKRWNGDSSDTSLVDLMVLLQAIVDHDVDDVREVLKVYHEYDDPIVAFRERRKEMRDKIEAMEAAQKEQEKSKVSRWSPSFIKKFS